MKEDFRLQVRTDLHSNCFFNTIWKRWWNVGNSGINKKQQNNPHLPLSYLTFSQLMHIVYLDVLLFGLERLKNISAQKSCSWRLSREEAQSRTRGARCRASVFQSHIERSTLRSLICEGTITPEAINVTDT